MAVNSSNAGDVPPFDRVTVEKLRAEASRGAEDFFPMYVRYLCEDIRKAGSDLDVAARELRGAQLAEIGHRLRGAVGNFGAEPLIGLCRQLERLVKDGDIPAALELVPVLQAELRRVEAAALALLPA